MKTYLEKKPNLNVIDIHGKPVLNHAISNCKIEVVKLLLAEGRLPIDEQDAYGNTPLIYACERVSQDKQWRDVVVTLLEKEANANAINSNMLWSTAGTEYRASFF